MADRAQSQEETEKSRLTVPETAISMFQIRESAAQEIHRADNEAERRTRELGRALAVMSVILESTTDGILVTDEKVKVTGFNQKYCGMWKITREVLERETLCEVRKLMSRNFADPQRFISRIGEIGAAGHESFDLLELEDGRIFDRYSKVLTVDGEKAGRVWSFRDVTERHRFEITANRLAALVASSSDILPKK